VSAPTDPTPNPSARGWLRGNLGWLLGAAVLGTLAFWLPYREAQREYVERREPSHAIDAATGRWTRYENARWRLIDVRREDGLPQGAGGYLHGDASLLIVTYEVVPGPGIDSDVLDACNGRLVDARGRRWDADALPSAKLSERVRALGTSCGSRLGKDFVREKARPGWPFRFHHVFVVPRDLPRQGLRSELMLPASKTTPPGRYLRFTW
jgi:hypothetical protein